MWCNDATGDGSCGSGGIVWHLFINIFANFSVANVGSWSDKSCSSDGDGCSDDSDTSSDNVGISDDCVDSCDESGNCGADGDVAHGKHQKYEVVTKNCYFSDMAETFNLSYTDIHSS